MGATPPSRTSRKGDGTEPTSRRADEPDGAWTSGADAIDAATSSSPDIFGTFGVDLRLFLLLGRCRCSIPVYRNKRLSIIVNYRNTTSSGYSYVKHPPKVIPKDFPTERVNRSRIGSSAYAITGLRTKKATDPLGPVARSLHGASCL